MNPIEFELPVRIESLNVLKRNPRNVGSLNRLRFALRRKVKMQRHAATLMLLSMASPGVRRQLLAAERVVVTLTRIAPGTLDREDNLTAGFKAVRDGLADALKLNDRDSRLRWVYEQQHGGPKVYSARVCLEAMSSDAFAERLAARERAA